MVTERDSKSLDGNKSRSPGRRYAPLAGVLLVFLLLALLYMRTFPPFEGPDEPQHFAYITWLAQQRSLPPQGETAWETPVEQEAGQPPFYYLVTLLPALIAGFDPPAEYNPNPYFIGPFPRSDFDNDHRAIHYPGEAQPLKGEWLAFYLARGVTLLFGLVLVTGVYLLGRVVWPGHTRLPLLAAMVVAFMPQVLFLSGVISNDIPAAALATLALWQFARFMRDGYAPGRVITIGLLLGLGVLTKVSVSTLALPLGAGLLWRWQHDRLTEQAFSLWVAGGLMAGATLLVTGWWFVHNWVRYGAPLGLEAHDLTPWAVRGLVDVNSPTLRWLEVFRSYWAGLGWGTIRPPGWVYALLFIIAGLAMIGWGRALWRWRHRPDRSWSVQAWSVQAVLYALLLLAVVAVSLFLEVWMHRVNAPYGRLVYPAIGATTILLVAGLYWIHPRLPQGFIAGLALLAVMIPFWVVTPAFTPPEPLSTEEAAAITPDPGWIFLDPAGRPVAELLRAEPILHNLENVQDAAQLPVEVCLRALAQTEVPYTLSLQIIGPENRLIANRRTYPGLGLWPTTQWQPGDVYCDLVRIRFFGDLQETLVYYLEVSLLDDERDERLAVVDPAGNVLEATFVDRVRLEAPGAVFLEEPAGDSPALLDYQAGREWQRGTSPPLTLTWALNSAVEADYQTFVHLRREGENAAQADGPPLDGWYGTSWWQPNELVTDRRAFPVPDDLAPGTYSLVVGFYELATGRRWGNEFDLGQVEIR